MRYEKSINFRFKGGRTYVHGTDIYAVLLEAINDFSGYYPANVNGSFHFPLKNNGILRIYENNDSPDMEQAAAFFSVSINEKNYQVGLFDAGTPITSSYAYDEEEVLKNMVIEHDVITMACKPDFTYIEQLVAMTKKLHLTIYPDARGHWLFTKIQINDFIDSTLYADKTLKVKAEKNFQNKLTQSSLSLDDRVAGSIFFSTAEDLS